MEGWRGLLYLPGTVLCGRSAALQDIDSGLQHGYDLLRLDEAVGVKRPELDVVRFLGHLASASHRGKGGGHKLSPCQDHRHSASPGDRLSTGWEVWRLCSVMHHCESRPSLSSNQRCTWAQGVAVHGSPCSSPSANR